MFEELSKELQEKAKACKTAEELSELAETEGFTLTDEMLDSLSGGIDDSTCIWLDACTSYCQIYIYMGKSRYGDSYDCTWVAQADPLQLPITCMEVSGI